MKIIKNVSISAKLALGFLVLVVITFVIAAVNYSGSERVARQFSQTADVRMPAALVASQAQSDLLSMLSAVRGYLALSDKIYLDDYDQASAAFEAGLSQLEDLSPSLSPADKLRLIELRETYEKWLGLPDQLVTLHDNPLKREPAYAGLVITGTQHTAIVLTNIGLMIDSQAQQPPSAESNRNMQAMARFQGAYSSMFSALRGYVTTKNRTFKTEFETNRTAASFAWDELARIRSRLTANQQTMLAKVEENQAGFLALSQDILTIMDGDQWRADLYLFRTEAVPLATSMQALLGEMVGDQQTLLEAGVAEGQASLAETNRLILAGGIGALLVAIILAFALNAVIVRPVRRLTATAEQIRAGHLVEAVVDSRDEIGTLADTFNTMTGQLVEAQKTAERASFNKSIYLANMSHELRTPLNAILGFSQIMALDTNLTATQKHNLDIINRSGDNLLALINDILELAKIEAGRITLSPEVFNLVRLLDDMQMLFQSRAEAKGISLIVDYPEGMPTAVRGDKGKLRQIMLNLLSNAVKFTSEGGVAMKAKIAPADGYLYRLVLEVSDTGPGIDQDEIDKLFSAFVQTRSGVQSKQGTGLGLALSREFARLMQGDISVTSTVGVGATFHVEVVLEETAELPEDTEPDVKVIGVVEQGICPRVLIVDDREESRRLLRAVLEPIGCFELREAADGLAAYQAWEEWQPDLILMDMRMPVESGYEAATKIKGHPRGSKTKIVAVTASALEDERRDILESGCDGYVRKPFRKEEIYRAITEYLGLHFKYESLDDSHSLAGHSPGELDTKTRRELAQAASTGNIAELQKIVAGLPAEDPLTAALKRNVANFDFEVISRWLVAEEDE